nr:pentatricopeptide repeat protein AaPPR1229 [Agave angustifolia]
MYAKCGDLNSSKRVFDELPAKNIMSWNAMIGALGMNGCAKEALAVLREMEVQNVRPNGVTMLSVLSACSHGGLIEDGRACFERMLKDASLQPSLEHYSCMVDMLGRAGDLEGAFEVIKRMPEGLEAGPAAWGALLSACRSHGNLELGQCAASRLIELEPENSAGYLLCSSMFAKRRSSDNTARMRWLMRERRLKMVSGYSLVHVEQRAHKFVAWDVSHPQCEEIYSMVEDVHDCMKQAAKEITDLFY